MKDTGELQEVDLRTAGERELAALHELSVVLMSEELPEDPPMPYEEWVSDIRSMPSYKRVRCWLAWDSNQTRLIGASWFIGKYLEENRHIGYLQVALRPEKRGGGLASRLLLPAVEAATADGRTLCAGQVFEGGPGVEFADAVGAKVAILDYHNRLTLAGLDRPMLEEWVARASERASDYSLLFHEGSWRPEDREKVADLVMVMNTAPRSESQEEERTTPEMIAEWDALAEAEGYVPWTYVARHDPSGEWVGLTRMWPAIYRKEFAYQDDTLVRPQHRNRGLGRWLKAAMLIKLLDELPATRWVETWNATSNEAMLNINRALGFKPILVWQRREIETEKLASWLKSRVS